MGIGYKIDFERNGVYIKFSEKLTGNDLIQINKLLYSYDQFETMKYQLWDYTNTKEILITEEEVEIIGVLDKAASRWNNSMLVALVGKSDEFASLIEIYKKEISEIDWTCVMFNELDSARLWLNNNLTSKINS